MFTTKNHLKEKTKGIILTRSQMLPRRKKGREGILSTHSASVVMELKVHHRSPGLEGRLAVAG